MKKLRLLMLALALLVLISTLAGCSMDNEKKQIFKDDKRIAAQGDSYSFSNRLGGLKDSVLQLEYSKFYGSDTVLSVAVKNDGEIKISYESELSKGLFKAVIITPEDEVIKIFEHSSNKGQEQGFYTLNAEPGSYRLKIVGVDAGGKLTLEVTLGDGMELIESSK